MWTSVFVLALIIPSIARAQITPINNPGAFAPSHTLQQFESPFFGPQANWGGVNITWKGGNPAVKKTFCGSRPYGPVTCPTPPATNTIDNQDPFTGNFGGLVVIDFPSPINMFSIEAAYNFIGSKMKVEFYSGGGATLVGTAFGPPAPPAEDGGGAPAGWVFIGFHSVTPFNRLVLNANFVTFTPSGYMRLDNLRYDVGSPLTYCGDHIVNNSESCDDGNLNNGDGCSAVCTTENSDPFALCSDRTVNAGASCTAAASINNGSNDPDPGDSITTSQAPPGPFALGTTPATLTVTDTHGATATCTGIVNVVDTTAPSIACPAPAQVECTAGTGNATITATGSDNCSAITPNCSAASGSFPFGTTNYTCSAVDAAGNPASCGSSVTVVDTQPPMISCPAPVVVECSAGTGHATITASATDACSAVSANCTASTGLFPVGTTNYTCNSIDPSGNSASCGSSVKVVDTTPPTVSCVPGPNPSSKNFPNANAGFRTVTGGDSCSATTTLKLGSYVIANGENIKITVSTSASGVSFVGLMNGVRHFIVGPGMNQIVASDGTLMTTASCAP